MRSKFLFGLLLLASALSGCISSSMEYGDEFQDAESWVLIPLINESDSLTADQSATTLVDEHLRRRGVNTVAASTEMVDTSQSKHVVTGRIIDWKYNQLTRPKPEVKIALHVYDLETQQLLWRKETSRTGSSGESIVAVADEVLAGLVSSINLSNSSGSNASQNDQAVDAAVEQLASQANLPIPSSQAISVSGNTPQPNAQGLHDVKLGQDSLPLVNSSVDQFAPGGSIALYYAVNPPVPMLNQFDRVVLEPDAVTASQLSEFNQNPELNTTLFAYLSVGEVGPTRQWGSDIDSAWKLGVNEAWNSSVMDMANPAWRAFLMRRADTLLRAGYQGFFLDTMDSYQLFAKTDEQRQRQQQGLITFIASLKAKHPNVQLIANRGFELLPSIAQYLNVIAAESLYARWHGGSGGYQDVPEQDRQWLLSQLSTARSQYGLEALSIDYVEPNQRDKARKVAAKIANHGIIPWVSTPGLDQMGVGLEEVYPREVLLLFDGEHDAAIQFSLVHRMIATPLEYYGYVPRYLDMSKDTLPEGNLSGRYAGVVSWTQARFSLVNWSTWLQNLKNNGVPVVLLGNFSSGTSSSVLEELGLKRVEFEAGAVAVSEESSLVGYETQPAPRIEYVNSPYQSVAPSHQIHLAFKNEQGSEFDAIATTPWGGYGITSGLIDINPDGYLKWVIDPFKFLKQALRLPDLPQPDVTTQTGKRITLAHIDGDALPSWAEMPGRRLGAEVLYDEIISPFKIPHTISIVEAEMVAQPQFMDRYGRMYAVIRKMFQDDHVQLATHTYSHPFKWDQIKPGDESGKYNLPVPNYAFSYEREIDGSVDFINQKLAPEGKKVEVVLWSGNAVPNEEALERVAKLGLQNMNGGGTTISSAYPYMFNVSPMVRTAGKYDQIYAPIMNENVYTNDWLGPFDGFRRVLETFEMTDSPRRLKPINIYYHFYSGTKIASMRAMKEVYEWTMNQDIAPLFVDSYTKRVGEFRTAQVSRSVDGWWSVSGLEETQSIRWQNMNNAIDVATGQGVAGQRVLHDGLYIHPTSNGVAKFRINSSSKRTPELVSSNGQITSWSRRGHALDFRIQAEVPVELVLKNAKSCQLSGPKGTVKGISTDDGLKFSFTQKDTGNVSLRCPA